jgi:cytochrome c oxidase assembly factor CtaG
VDPALGALALLCLSAVLLAGPAGAMAHPVDAPAAGVAWRFGGSFEPWVIVLLAVSAALYAAGLRRLWRHAGRGRGVAGRAAAAFGAGWLALAVALVSPLDPLGTRLFSAHMLQHELLMVVAAPLMLIGRPLAVWAWALPRRARRRVGDFFHHPAWRLPWLWISAPLAAWLLHAAALWLWHVPALFEAALHDGVVHTWQHFSFLFSALLFWWSALGQATRPRQGGALVYLFTTMVHSGALGALITLSPSVWYPSYLPTTAALGIDALEDQQLGGLVMWVPAGLAYLCTGLALAARWIGAPPRRGQRVQQTPVS